MEPASERPLLRRAGRIHLEAFDLRPRSQPRYTWHRLDALVDAVYAIAATLLVLEIRRPDVPAGQLGRALLDQGPEYGAYALGFVQIAGGWLILRRLSAWCTGIDHYGTLLILPTVSIYSLTPFTTGVLAAAVGDDEDFGSAVRLMAVVIFSAMVTFSAAVAHLFKRGLFREDLDARKFQSYLPLFLTPWVWPALAFGLSFLSPGLGLGVLAFYFLLTLTPWDAMPSEPHTGLDRSASTTT